MKKTHIASYIIIIFILQVTLSVANDKEKYYTDKSTQSEYYKIVAEKYGLNNFTKVKTINYTFNVKFKGKHRSRKWKWNVANNEVIYWGPNKKGRDITYTYNSKNVDNKNDLEKLIDSRFINDQYWLLFPFHLVWDKRAVITDKQIRLSPINKKKTHCLIITYPIEAGGYTPGDIFELYIGKDNLILEWVYRPGGSKTKRFSMTWEKNINFSELIFSTLHFDKNKDFQLWFSDVSVELKK